MIGQKTEAVLNRAMRFAIEHEHEYLTLEHVFWSLLDERDVAETVRACGGNAAQLRRELEESLKKDSPKACVASEGGALEPPVATLSIQRLIQRALFHVQSAGKDEIQPIDLMVALFQAKDSQALNLLMQQGVERLDALNYISHGIEKDAQGLDAATSEELQNHDEGKFTKPASDPLALYTVDLNERARAGKTDPLVGRQVELSRMIQTLCRRRKNNPLLVGEAGVGKTALAEGLALHIVSTKVPPILKDCVIYALDLGALLAGAKFRGDFEQRLKRVISALHAKRERGRQPILFIDEIHTLIGAGAVSGGVMDAANLLKPLLTQGEICCIGSTTYAEFRNVFEKDHALARRFQKIDVTEPTPDEAIQILSGLKSRFEEHHGVQYAPDAIRVAVELSSKHLRDRFLPDKAIDVLDEAGARARLSGSKVIAAGAVEEVIAQIARIPARTVSSNQKERLRNLERDLNLTIFGQDLAIDAVVAAIRLARSGLRTGDGPVGSFLFCGPTGVGKTELSKQLAHSLGVPFLRFDMSEYSEKHTVSRLIGAPPGYVGFEQSGLLTDAVLKNPYAVVLLDEIEKAHFDIWNILLQVMDHGALTDNNGRKADFCNIILLMTSNVGSRELERRPLGIDQAHRGVGLRAQKAVEQAFSPEFRNRLDAVVYFNALDPVTLGHVVEKHVMELESQLLAKGVDIELDLSVREWLASKGYDHQMGARPLGRLLQEKIKKPLAEEILFGKLENGGHVRVVLRDDAPAFEFQSKPAQEKIVRLEQSNLLETNTTC
jgi:ATP-dependent Clp protease ATP-binding subunit ClpA